MIKRYKYIIRRADGVEYNGRLYSKAEAKYVYDRYDLQSQGFFIMETLTLVKTKTDLINEILSYGLNIKLYKLWFMSKKKLERIVKWKTK